MRSNKGQIYFQPTFGNRPESIVGREKEINSFINGLEEPIGSRDRCTLFLGQRGMGKTALLIDLADRASKKGFVVARVTAFGGMQETIIEQIQINGARFFDDEKRHLTGASVGVLGFSFGLTFNEVTQQQFGFRSKMSMICDKLAEKGKGVLILIDEVHSSRAMREVATSYQELIGDGKNIAIGMAGLPHAVSGVLNDTVLTFLNRATKVKLGEISTPSISAYYEYAFGSLGIDCSDDLIEKAAEKTKGFPYLMQLIGYYLVQYSQATGAIDAAVLDKAERAAIYDLENNVFEPILTPLSDKDYELLSVMAAVRGSSKSCSDRGDSTNLMNEDGTFVSRGKDGGLYGARNTARDSIKISDVKPLLEDEGASIQVYRKRLKEAGIIESPRRGELTFAVPYLADYLVKLNAE